MSQLGRAPKLPPRWTIRCRVAAGCPGQAGSCSRNVAAFEVNPGALDMQPGVVDRGHLVLLDRGIEIGECVCILTCSMHAETRATIAAAFRSGMSAVSTQAFSGSRLSRMIRSSSAAVNRHLQSPDAAASTSGGIFFDGFVLRNMSPGPLRSSVELAARDHCDHLLRSRGLLKPISPVVKVVLRGFGIPPAVRR
jgi:hypothetical protein